MNKWFAIAVALAGCGTSAVEGPTAASDPAVVQHDIETDRPLEAPELASVDSFAPDQEAPSEAVKIDPMEGETVAATEEPGAEPTEPAVPVHTFELKRGESLHHFARWSEQPIERVAEISELPLDGSYAVGTEVKLQLTREDRSIVEARRDAHHQTRAQAYLDSRGPHSTGFYTVKTGDTAWKIAQSTEAIPVWLIESMNPSVDLERLRPGAELLVPVFQDVTASLDDEEE